jgi:2,5-dihydroxypyridine 5,6-dioxygenase
MIADRIEGKWLDAFREVFALCGVRERDPVAILSETQGRALNVHLAKLALHLLGARPWHVVVPTPHCSATTSPHGATARRTRSATSAGA